MQKSIILNLARTSPLRFTELQPPRIPNNTFSYHLKKLIDSGYVESTGKGYVATRKALKLIAYGVSNNRPQATPQIVSMIYIENTDGEILLINRNHKPFQSWYGLPSGLVHQGETLQDAARRELLEKTSLTADEDLCPVGVLEIRYVEEGTDDIFMHTVAFIYKYGYRGDKSVLEDKVNRYGQLSWSKLGRNNILTEVIAVKEMVEKNVFDHESIVLFEPSQLPTLIEKPNLKRPPRKIAQPRTPKLLNTRLAASGA